MKNNLPNAIDEVSKHLNCDLSEEKKKVLAKHLDFDNFKKNPAVSLAALTKGSGKSFLRKGEVGDWHNHFSEDLAKDWNLWIEEEKRKLGIDRML